MQQTKCWRSQMKLYPVEKSTELLLPILSKATLLHVWNKGTISITKESVLSAQTKNYIIFAVHKEPALIGVVDLLHCSEQNTSKSVLMIESSLADIIEAVQSVESIVTKTGSRKLSILIQTHINGVMDGMKELGYSSEVRLRQHSWVDGKFLSVSEYGKIL